MQSTSLSWEKPVTVEEEKPPEAAMFREALEDEVQRKGADGSIDV